MDDRRAVDHASYQRDLINFLNIDLDLAFTMLQTAVLEAEDPERRQQALSNVRNAITTIVGLSRRLEDREVLAGIHDRTNRLRVALQEISN